MTTLTEPKKTQLNQGDGFQEVMQRVEAILPVIRASSAENEKLGRLTDEVVEALHDSGAFRIGIPVELGGYELTPRQTIELVEKVSYADPSTGWVLMAVQMITCTTAAYLPETGRDELFGDGKVSLTAGQGTLMGKAKRVDGGYRVSGQWSFGSGLLHSSHIHTAAFDEENQRGIIVTLPKEKATVYDNWDVMGLRATGSVDYSLDDVFVSDDFVYETTTTTPVTGGAIFRLGLANMSGIGHTGWALGVGRRLLDEMKAYAAKKSSVPVAATNSSHFQADYARAEAILRSARAFAMDVWADNEATLDTGELLSTEQETLTRLMLNNTTWSAHEVANIAHLWTATTMARRGELQQLFRDMNVGTAHVTSGPGLLQSCGKQLAGLAPGASWQFIQLVEPEGK